MDEVEDKDKLTFTVSFRDPYLAVSLKGKFNKNSQTVIDECLKSILESTAQSITLIFKEIEDINRHSIHILVKFQIAIRKKPAILTLCEINPELVEYLISQAAIRKVEIFQTLPEAILAARNLLSKK